jgi:CubicO group peptidase (beta-lactamase class C family)
MQAFGRRSMLALAVIALVAAAAGLSADSPLAAPESVGFSADGLKTFQRTMCALVDESKLAGVTTLIARHGKVVYLDAYGVQDLTTKKPVARDTIFRLASMTKPIVGVAMMMLWEQGKWALDDPVAKRIGSPASRWPRRAAKTINDDDAAVDEPHGRLRRERRVCQGQPQSV